LACLLAHRFASSGGLKTRWTNKPNKLRHPAAASTKPPNGSALKAIERSLGSQNGT
jgi:hypothetical protein